MSMWPNKGEADQRPAVGEQYRPVDACAPQSPVVSAEAVGALRIVVHGA
jgi:cholesterol oxidase